MGGNVSDSWCGKYPINGVVCPGFMEDYGQGLMICIRIRKWKYVLDSWGYVLDSWNGLGFLSFMSRIKRGSMVSDS
ncbi:hypothetical protein QJS04_geneDACA018647 [Acorus gramineus]|uniref:Uncharacterized protein n=1 Tax=Acorus gramineus TaxID=55184 RepID=A0AAV9AHQ5_ACOGR|nr:hypothetical protein QJS04_geneDACA018647 [Acorus gramineus]